MDLKTFMEERDVKRLIVADASNEVVIDEQRGELPYAGLFTTLFGDRIRVGRLRESLVDQLLPQSWGQGGLAAYVTVTDDGYLVGVFCTPPKGADAVATYLAGEKLINDSIPLIRQQLGQ